jgi:hypothetical protein
VKTRPAQNSANAKASNPGICTRIQRRGTAAAGRNVSAAAPTEPTSVSDEPSDGFGPGMPGPYSSDNDI